MGLSERGWRDAVKARRRLKVSDFPRALSRGVKSLADAGWDGDYVVPNQLSSRSLNGPLLLLNNWFGWQDLQSLDAETNDDLGKVGYLKGISTNRWLDCAFKLAGLTRSDVYITQACVFLPRNAMHDAMPVECYLSSVEHVLRKELGGRTPIAWGTQAQRACQLSGIDFVAAHHPSYQGGERRAQEIAAAIRQVL